MPIDKASCVHAVHGDAKKMLEYLLSIELFVFFPIHKESLYFCAKARLIKLLEKAA